MCVHFSRWGQWNFKKILKILKRALYYKRSGGLQLSVRGKASQVHLKLRCIKKKKGGRLARPFICWLLFSFCESVRCLKGLQKAMLMTLLYTFISAMRKNSSAVFNSAEEFYVYEKAKIFSLLFSSCYEATSCGRLTGTSFCVMLFQPIRIQCERWRNVHENA